MHRDDAYTVSLSHVSVSSQGISFRYADGSPCEAELGPALAMKFVEPASEIDQDIKINSNSPSIAALK